MVFTVDIKQDDLTGAEIIALVSEHFQSMADQSPPESMHALNLDGLRKPEITFWSAWTHNELMGCGALKEIDSGHGEIKSMRTASKHLRKGVAKRILEHMIDVAKQRGYVRLSLETGSMASFQPAIVLYERLGFRYCEPFANYSEDPNSVFMTLEL